ncbi:sigma-70 family RNA polymerase sigma factor [Ktedonosporobacter rubrisoli]|uniref:Sigma-70 family RNA polymerase sigma factor n=1 Tax=Ktedonosporobacter rubrisoli TaxID=2509675 RepID=A0A4P6JXS8_KTERU|nr:RNA polymerase sigma factor [Ktedonosporobacter rubrisoli]QBD79826.1 sigma-70 family RNA polymerase sigma factor [Ktedonosporobacter rubrisoli]
MQSHQHVPRTSPLAGKDYSLPAALYQLYAARLFSYLCRHVPSGEDAEDLLLEVFLAVLEHEQTLATRQEDEQRAWLWTVARNKVRDFHRRAVRRRHTILLEQATEIAGDERSGPEAVLLRQETHHHLHLQLQRLSAMQQEVLQLHFTGGLNCVEIAAVLHKREGAIRALLSRAVNKLRAVYTRKEGELTDGQI